MSATAGEKDCDVPIAQGRFGHHNAVRIPKLAPGGDLHRHPIQIVRCP